MEREAPSDIYRMMRAIRSLAYNRELQPLVEGRIERAESKIRGYLLTNSLTATRIGPYQVEINEEGDIDYSRLPVDDNWQQLSLPQVTGSQEAAEVSADSGNGMISRENVLQIIERRQSDVIVPER